MEKKWDFITRRGFIKTVGAGTLALSLNSLTIKSHSSPQTVYPYKNWEDIYRNKWKWDKIVKGSHAINCLSVCSWDLYIKDGIVWREEQACQYSSASPEIPDFNPRGCQKGCLHSEFMYGEEKIKYPLKRMGQRGEGKWKRISWDEALTEIADKVLDIVQKYGPEYIAFTEGSNLDGFTQISSLFRFAGFLGATILDVMSSLGDLPIGATITLGTPWGAGMSAEWYKSNYILLWNFNPSATRIPDAHFFWEAKYNGTQVVNITPDYSPTAIHCDYWMNPRAGTDAALALAMAHVIVNEKLYDAPYIKEQTDLPLLVRNDNGYFLREKDLKDGGRDDVFYFWDLKSNGLAKAPGSQGDEAKTIALGQLDPALEGSWDVETRDGKVKVRTVFERLKDKLMHYPPEKASQITGVGPEAIREVARGFARAERAMIAVGFGMNKWYHSDLFGRSLILLASLTGNIGKIGGGFFTWNPIYDLQGVQRVALMPHMRVIPWVVWDYVHGELKKVTELYLGKETADFIDKYVKESVQKGWMPLYPKEGSPKMMFFAGDNSLAWKRANHIWKENLWPKLEMIVTLTTRTSSTALNSDFVLPVADHYEVTDLFFYHWMPYMHALVPAVEPLWETKTDWQIFRLLAEKVAERAKQRGFAPYEDKEFSITRDLSKIHLQYTENGKFSEEKAVLDYMLKNSPATADMTYDQIAEKGIVRFQTVPPGSIVYEGEGMPFNFSPKPHVESKRSWKTLTGRHQFYIDHPWYLELGEELPVYKEPLGAKEYPLRLNTGHTRWGVHTSWRSHKTLLRLQRGEPMAFMNPEDCEKRNIRDGDMIRIYNKVGDMKATIKVSPQIPPGEVFMYHGWDPLLFEEGRNFNAPVGCAGMLKPTGLVGGYGHLQYRFFEWGSVQPDRDTTVEAEKVEG